ncbi:unnamed protein product [Cylindrotheca closterium]|uniref:Leucine-rich repeat domain-containing protein n=1 Tax=Cylindrotheca closterium TaxID=2856 RepID=A0AAD2FPZ6_9STRA|nr:unnamed protein product [Cylindrotheca closterium]
MPERTMMHKREYLFNGQSKSEVPRDITDVAVDDSVEKIADGLFFQCERLVAVDLLEGLRIIGAFAFGRCTSLTSISIPSTVEEISEDTFCYCKSLTTVHLENGLQSIGKRAFESCTSLTLLSIPSTVENIDRSAFRSCTSLKTVEMREGLKLIGSHSFYECKALTGISVPSTVWKIGAHAFAKCKSLVDVQFQDGGLKNIGQMTFHLCSSLFAISLPKSLESTGNALFLDCSTLLGVEFPLGINVKMENHTFASCSALVNIFIPPSIDDEEGFGKCTNCFALDRMIGNQDTTEALKTRFDNRPIHEACYYASRTTVYDMAAIPVSISEDGDTVVDSLGMSPFHIVATSANQRGDLLETLFDRYPLEVASRKDKNGKTMMDYLLINRSPKAIPLIQMVLQRTLVDPMSTWGLTDWKLNLSSMVMESDVWQGHAGIRRQSLKRVQNTLELFRRMEKTSLLELAIWKMAVGRICEMSTQSASMDREGYRIVGGADVIIPQVIRFVAGTSSA